MMREILFKAKRKNWRDLPKEEWWVEGYYMPRPNSPGKPRYYIVSLSQAKWYEIDPDTLCQYTELKDKNGNRIWENDICVLNTNSIDEEDGYFKVEYDKDNARFVFLGVALQFDFECIRDDECEVVGTIFEHPELQEYLQRYL